MEHAWKTEIWQAFRAGDLTRARRDVLLGLPKFRGRGGLIFPSYEALAKQARCCARTVGRTLAAAAKLGLLTWRERRKRAGLGTERDSNLYTLRVKNPDKPPIGQGVRVATQEDSFFLLTAPDATDSRAALARIAAERTRKLAQERRSRLTV